MLEKNIIEYQTLNKIDFSTYKYLFLDRDGVINVERPNDYVKTVSEFIFTEGAVKAIAEFCKMFDRIFIVTNQRGLGRGKYSEEDLDNIHLYMMNAIEAQGGKIDKIYYCPHLTDAAINRKPNIGMGFQAKRDYPEVDFAHSILIGNSQSDIEFGNKLGMLTVLVGDKYDKGHIIYKNINVYCENLSKFVDCIKS